MIEELAKNGLMNEMRYLTLKGQVHFKEKVAGKTTSVVLGRLTGYTPVFVRMILGGFRRVNHNNVIILATIDRIAEGFAESYPE
jgi:hypothetical protein